MGGGPERLQPGLVVATADPGHPARGKANLVCLAHEPAPARRPAPRPASPATPAAVPGRGSWRIYGIRHWVRAELQASQGRAPAGADFQGSAPTDIRHPPPPGCWSLTAPFSFCWDAWFDEKAPPQHPRRGSTAAGDPAAERGAARRHRQRARPGPAGRCAPESAPGFPPLDPARLRRAGWPGVVPSAPPPPATAGPFIDSVAAGHGPCGPVTSVINGLPLGQSLDLQPVHQGHEQVLRTCRPESQFVRAPCPSSWLREPQRRPGRPARP